ncbi:MAG: hypothetical protein J7L34_02805, partial [Thermotogaceae bacterium]|nr:hypothetical protein [Thermotogaceae bacterium]
MEPIYGNYWYYSYLPILFNNTQNISPLNATLQIMPTYELPDIYKSTFNINEYAQSVSDFQQDVNNLRTSAENLMSVFSERSLQISNEGLTGIAQENAPIGQYNVEVVQLAKAQVNEGNWLTATNLDFQTGSNTFSINLGDNTYSFTVNITSEMNNLDVLDQIAEQINKADIGLSATVETQNDQARLVITGQTGESSAFTISDVSGNIVSTSGISNVAQNSQNLIYSIDNIQYENETNQITTIPGVALTANEVGSYTVNVTYNPEEIQNATENFVNAFNQVAEEAQQFNNPSINAMLETIANNPMLKSAGIENVNGQLQITDQFEAALQNQEVVQNTLFTNLTSVASTAINVADMLRNIPSYQILNYQTNNFLNFGQQPDYSFDINEYLKNLYEYNLISTMLSVNLFNTYT